MGDGVGGGEKSRETMSATGRREGSGKGKQPMPQSRARATSTKTWKENKKTSDNGRINDKVNKY